MTATTAFKRKLSGSTDGMPIKVTGTATAGGVTIHTAVAGTTAGTYDEIWLWANNTANASVANVGSIMLTLEFGDTTAPDHNIIVPIPPQSGWVLVCPGIPLQNGKIVTAFSSEANNCNIAGYVNSMTDA